MTLSLTKPEENTNVTLKWQYRLFTDPIFASQERYDTQILSYAPLLQYYKKYNLLYSLLEMYMYNESLRTEVVMIAKRDFILHLLIKNQTGFEKNHFFKYGKCIV